MDGVLQAGMGTVCCFFIIGVSLVGIIIGINSADRTLLAKSKDVPTCPVSKGTSPNIQNFTAQARMFIWNNEYVFNESNFRIRQRCPTPYTNDGYLLQTSSNDNEVQVAAVNINSILSAFQQSEVYDCKGNRMYTIRTANFGETILNFGKVKVALKVYDGDETFDDGNLEPTPLAFSEGTHWFWNDKIIIRDWNTGYEIARLQRSVPSITTSFIWSVYVYDQYHQVANYGLLASLMSRSSFIIRDGCNSFYVDTIWTLGFMALIIFALIGMVSHSYLYGDNKPGQMSKI